MVRVVNHTGREMGSLISAIEKFLPSCGKRLGCREICPVHLIDDEENSQEILGKTAYYDPENKIIAIYVTERHPKDILRSLSHEMVHHLQNERGDFDDELTTEPGYAQSNPKMRELEREAYEKGNLVFRDWEDEEKSKKQRISESWLQTLNRMKS